MSLTPSQRAQFQAILDTLTSARETAQTLLNELDSPDPEPEPEPESEPVPGLWPSGGTWAEKIAWIESRAGVKNQLVSVGPGNVPAGCRWSGSNLLVDTATLLENILVPGTIVTTDRSTANVTLRNVMAQDVFTYFIPPNFQDSRRVALIEDCDFSIPAARVIGGWGQGSLNTPKGGCIIRRTRMTGGADCAQVSGGAVFEECVFKDMTIHGPAGSGTHNDFIQNYGGLTTLRRCRFLQNIGAGQGSHLNGIFNSSSTATYDIEDCAIEVFAAQGEAAFALHAGSSVIDIRNSLLRGSTVGNIRIGPGVERF